MIFLVGFMHFFWKKWISKWYAKLWSSCLGFSVLNTALIYTTDTTVIHPANEYTSNRVNKTPEKAIFRHARYYYDYAYTLRTWKQRMFVTYLLTWLIKTTLQYENMISYKMITKCCNHLLRYCHWGRVAHICVGNQSIIGSDNGLSPYRRQAIIWTNDEILLIGPLGTNFREISIEILTFSFKKMHFKVSSAKRRPFCPGLNVLIRFGDKCEILIHITFWRQVHLGGIYWISVYHR